MTRERAARAAKAALKALRKALVMTWVMGEMMGGWVTGTCGHESITIDSSGKLLDGTFGQLTIASNKVDELPFPTLDRPVRLPSRARTFQRRRRAPPRLARARTLARAAAGSPAPPRTEQARLSRASPRASSAASDRRAFTQGYAAARRTRERTVPRAAAASRRGRVSRLGARCATRWSATSAPVGGGVPALQRRRRRSPNPRLERWRLVRGGGSARRAGGRTR